MSVGDRIAQKVTTIEWNSISLGKYSTISFVMDDNLSSSHLLCSFSSDSVGSVDALNKSLILSFMPLFYTGAAPSPTAASYGTFL